HPAVVPRKVFVARLDELLAGFRGALLELEIDHVADHRAALLRGFLGGLVLGEGGTCEEESDGGGNQSPDRKGGVAQQAGHGEASGGGGGTWGNCTAVFHRRSEGANGAGRGPRQDG